MVVKGAVGRSQASSGCLATDRVLLGHSISSICRNHPAWLRFLKTIKQGSEKEQDFNKLPFGASHVKIIIPGS